MPSLTVDQRKIGTPSAPDVSAVGEAHATLGKVVQGVAASVGDYVKNVRVLEEKAIIATATNQLELAYITAKNNPQLTTQSLPEFSKQIDQITMGAMSVAQPASLPGLESEMKQLSQKYQMKLTDTAMQNELALTLKEANLTINEIKDDYERNIQSGDIQSAARSKKDLEELTQAYSDMGAPAKTISSIEFDAQVAEVRGYFTKRMKEAPSQEARKKVLHEMSALPMTNVNNKAFNDVYKQYNIITKLHKEGMDIAEPLNNVYTGNSYKNYTLDQKKSDEVEETLAKQSTQSQTPQVNTPNVTPSPFFGVNSKKTYKHYTDENGNVRDVNNFIAETVVDEKQTAPTRELGLLERAHIRAEAGTVNGKKFDNALINALMAGNGDVAAEAVQAITYVYQKNENALSLPAEAEIVYRKAKRMIDGGSNNYQNVFDSIRAESSKISAEDIKHYDELFKEQFSSPNKIAKVMKKYVGANVSLDESAPAFIDYKRVLNSNFILSKGDMETAIDTTNREMSRTHGTDAFSNGAYVRYPVTKMMPGLTEEQIRNQLLMRVVTSGNDKLSYQDSYNDIKSATEADLMNHNYTDDLSQIRNQPVRVEYNGPNGKVKGELYLKSNEFTAQSGTDKPVWEIWIKTDQDKKYPIIDDRSPVRNTMMFSALTQFEMAPEYTKQLSKEEINKKVNDLMNNEGMSLYRSTLTDKGNIILAEQIRNAYMKSPENRAMAESKIRKAMGVNK